MRNLILFAALLLIPQFVTAEELSDTDVEMIVQLANSLWKSEILSMQEIGERHGVTDNTSYRNVRILLRTSNYGTRSIRVSKIDGDWRLDEKEQKRLQDAQNFRAMLEATYGKGDD